MSLYISPRDIEDCLDYVDFESDSDRKEIAEWFEERTCVPEEEIIHLRCARKGDEDEEGAYEDIRREDGLEIDQEFTCLSGNVFLVGYNLIDDNEDEDEDDNDEEEEEEYEDEEDRY